MIRELYAHLDLLAEANRLRDLAASGAAVAHHADADGFLAAYFARRIFGRDGLVIRVTTDELDLHAMVDALAAHSKPSVVLFDINVLSFPAALSVLAEGVKHALVVDDHVGVAGDRPDNIELLELLPPDGAHYPGIRPASLFCYAILEAEGRTTALDDLLVNAAAYGEGVGGPFANYLPRISKSASAAARDFGWGLNGYFSDLGMRPDDARLLDALEGFDSAEAGSTEGFGQSPVAVEVAAASREVSAEVSRWAQAPSLDAPWFSVSGHSVYRVDIDSGRRIVNLVSSSLRTRANRGVSLATQETSAGVAVELRRARSLKYPDLVEALLRLPAEYVVSRGGHPMACGATFVRETAEAALQQLKAEITHGFETEAPSQ
mgnify:CR=1 FL=1